MRNEYVNTVRICNALLYVYKLYVFMALANEALARLIVVAKSFQ